MDDKQHHRLYLRWVYRRIQLATGVRRETVAPYGPKGGLKTGQPVRWLWGKSGQGMSRPVLSLMANNPPEVRGVSLGPSGKVERGVRAYRSLQGMSSLANATTLFGGACHRITYSQVADFNLYVSGWVRVSANTGKPGVWFPG